MPKSILSQSVSSILFAGFIISVPLTSFGDIFVWDTNTGTPGAQDGIGTWSVGAGNWFDQTTGAQNQNWVDGNDVIFGAGAGTAGIITLGSNVTINSLTFNSKSKNAYTLTGNTITNTTGVITANVAGTIDSILAGSAGLTLNGTGGLTLAGTAANTYTGLTTVNGGTLALADTGGIAINGDILVNAGGALGVRLANQIATTSSIDDAGGTVNLGGFDTTLQNLTLSTGGSVVGTGNTGNAASTVTINGVLAIAGGALTLNSGAAMTAPTVTMTGGNIIIGGGAATSLTIGSGGLSMTGDSITMNAGAASNLISLGGDVTASGNNTIAGSTNSQLQLGGANRTFNITSGTTTITAAITGTGDNFIKQGDGTLSLQNNETFTGSLTVGNGKMSIDGATGQLSGVTAVTVSGSGVLQDGSSTGALNNGITNRINPVVALTLGGSTGSGQFWVAYPAAAQTTSQTLASLTINQGANYITKTGVAAGTATLAFTGGYVRNVGGTVDFAANNPDLTISFTNAPTAAGGSSVSGTGSAAILTGAILASGDFVAAQAGPLTAANYTQTGSSTWTAGQNMDVTNDITTTAGTPINSLHFGTASPNNSFTVTLADTQIITSGMILENGNVGNSTTLTITGGSLEGSRGGDLVLAQYNTTDTLTINSVIADNFSATALTKAGTGTVILGASNTYTGQTYLNEGTLQITSNAALGDPATGATLNMDGGTLSTVGALNLDNGGADARKIVLDGGGGTFNDNGGTVIINGAISGVGGFTKKGVSTLILNNPGNTYAGTTTLTAGVLQIAVPGAIGSGTIVLDAGTLQLGGGVTSLSNAFNLIDNTTINSLVTGSPLTLSGTFTESGGGTIALTLNTQIAVKMTGNVILSTASNVFDQLQIQGSGTLEIDGVVSDNGSGSGITLNTTGNLVLAGNNTYTGRTVSAGGGAIVISSDQNLGTAPTTPMTDSLILAQGGGFLRVTQSFTLNANRNIGIGGQAGGSFTSNILVDPGQTFTVAGVIADRTVNADGTAVTGKNIGSLTKIGAGALVLQGQNTYSGNTTVSAGQLIVGGSIGSSSTTTTAVAVSGGATLALIGSGAITAGTLTLNDTSTLSLQVGSLTSNTITLTGAATLTGNIALALNLTADPVNGQTFTIIDGGSALLGYSSGARFQVNGTPVADGSIFMVNSNGFSQEFQITYGDGNSDVTLTALAVPEPGTLSTLLGATCLMAGLQRFRRRGQPHLRPRAVCGSR